jgi:hypothetical protein
VTVDSVLTEVEVLLAAGQEAAEALAGFDSPDYAQHFTCTEADAVVALIRAYVSDEAADAVLHAHAERDDDGDDEEHVRIRNTYREATP